MKTISTLTLSLLSFAVAGGADGNPDQAAITQAYRTLAKAIATGDNSGILSVYAPNFAGWGPRYEPVTREALTQRVPGLTIKSATAVPLNFERQGAAYRVTVRSTVTGEFNMGGQTAPFTQTQDSVEVWQKLNGRWQVVGSQNVTTTVNMAGQKQVLADPQPLTETQRQSMGAALRPLLTPVLPTVTKGSGDLSFLAPLARARVIGVGEGSHGTREHFLLKARMFRTLVEQYGFNTLAFESNMHGAESVNTYLSGQSDDLAAAVRGLGFAVWRTAEVRDLLMWMREYNGKRGTKPALKFVAVDMQHPGGSAELLTQLAPALKDTAAPFAELEPYEIDELVKDAGRREAFLKGAEALVKMAATLPTGTPRRAEVQRLARTVQQAVQAATGQGTRDDFMAENLLSALKADPQAKMMLWAHNSHISKAPDPLSDTGMGKSLAAALGQDYRTIGQTFSSGSIRAVQIGQEDGGMQTVPVASAHPDSLEALVGPKPAALVLSDAVKNPTLRDYLSVPRPLRGIGNSSTPGAMGYTFEKLPDAYDVLIFSGPSTPTTPAN